MLRVPPEAPADAAALRKTCVAAMNADPTFAAAITATADKQAAELRDAETVKRHQDDSKAIAQNKLHVILAYAAMWAIAALFVIFLWRRQQALKVELANLKDDLERAAKKANQ
ncbi:MAG: hypothetical protein H0T79_14465 [Deltaproteobacteria bacterium]|nr:hypothetical protein [Deltaproteobacteria bacterium]